MNLDEDKQVAIKHHVIGGIILCLVLACIIVPLAVFFLQYPEKIVKLPEKQILTRHEFDTVLEEAAHNLERGLYKQAHASLKKVSDRVLDRFFACEAFTLIGDLLYQTQFAPADHIKYQDALYFYLLAESRINNDGKQMWRAYQIANCHKNLNYISSAMVGYEKFLKQYPDSPYLEDVNVSYAYLLIKRKRFDEARNLILDIIKKTESETILADAVFELAQLYLHEARAKKMPREL